MQAFACSLLRFWNGRTAIYSSAALRSCLGELQQPKKALHHATIFNGGRAFLPVLFRRLRHLVDCELLAAAARLLEKIRLGPSRFQSGHQHIQRDRLREDCDRARIRRLVGLG